MPELPEMEHYRRLLAERLTGQTITGADATREKSLNVPVHTFQETLHNHRIRHVSRRAKHLLFHTDDGHVLLLHLMLGGSMYWGRVEDKPGRTIQVTLSFGWKHLFLMGLRLGYLHLHTETEAQNLLRKLGPEPLDPSFTEQQFRGRLLRKRGLLKPALVDQSFLSGIGNCYSDEICFYAGIQPGRTISTLSEPEIAQLWRGIRTVLPEAVAFGGYMETPFEKGDPITGGYNDRCKVYDRGGEPCYRCGATIVRSELASRKVFACSDCQR